MLGNQLSMTLSDRALRSCPCILSTEYMEILSLQQEKK